MILSRTTTNTLTALLYITAALNNVIAEQIQGDHGALSILQRDTLSKDWFGLGEELSEHGMSIDLGLTEVYQANMHGGKNTHRRTGRFAGSYDLELGLDMEEAFGLSGGSVYMLAEGSWSDGIDEASVGSLFGINDDAGGDSLIAVTELWYEQAFVDDRVRVRLGKIDMTAGFEIGPHPAAFDGNTYANDETSQFLNGALVNNRAIPFPDNGLGVMVCLRPEQWWYIAGGMADADANAMKTGFSTAFKGDVLGLVETGVIPEMHVSSVPLKGAYRIGCWYDSRSKKRFNGDDAKPGDAGMYLSFDQEVFKEALGSDDGQGLGLFIRYGFANGNINEIKHFWSAGTRYKGLLPGRDEDVLGFGAANGRLSGSAGFTALNETAMEWYYSVQITPWCVISPSVQYTLNPGGNDEKDNAVIAGTRLQIAF